jgi:hypothetical protein
LSDLSAGYSGIGFPAAQLLDQGPAGQAGEDLVDVGGGPRERPVGAEQVPAHPPPLRAHSAVDESRRAAVGSRPPASNRTVRHRGQPGTQVVTVAERHGEPIVVVRASRPHGVSQRSEGDGRVGGQREQLLGQLTSAGLVAAGHRQHLQRCLPIGGRGRPRGRHQHRVCVGAAVAEAVDGCRRLRVAGGEGFGLGDYPQAILGERDRRVEFVERGLGRQLAMV